VCSSDLTPIDTPVEDAADLREAREE